MEGRLSFFTQKNTWGENAKVKENYKAEEIQHNTMTKENYRHTTLLSLYKPHQNQTVLEHRCFGMVTFTLPG